MSYFAGTGGSLRRGMTMGARIAVFHVLSAIVVAFLFDLAMRQATGAAPSDYRLIRLGNHGLIIAIGAVMLWRAIAAIRATRANWDETQHAHSLDHPHAGCAAYAASASPRGAGLVAAAVGAVPCTGALLVMLFGLANDLVWPAILMVVAISLGMAVAMSVIGIAALWGRSWAEGRLSSNAKSQVRFELGARVAGAGCVLGIGLLLFGLTYAHQPIGERPADRLALHSNASD